MSGNTLISLDNEVLLKYPILLFTSILVTYNSYTVFVLRRLMPLSFGIDILLCYDSLFLVENHNCTGKGFPEHQTQSCFVLFQNFIGDILHIAPFRTTVLSGNWYQSDVGLSQELV